MSFPTFIKKIDASQMKYILMSNISQPFFETRTETLLEFIDQHIAESFGEVDPFLDFQVLTELTNLLRFIVKIPPKTSSEFVGTAQVFLQNKQFIKLYDLEINKIKVWIPIIERLLTLAPDDMKQHIGEISITLSMLLKTLSQEGTGHKSILAISESREHVRVAKQHLMMIENNLAMLEV